MNEPVRLVIDLKREADPEVVLNQLYQFTPLQETFSVHAIALVDGRPETLPLEKFLRCYRDYRVQVVRRREPARHPGAPIPVSTRACRTPRCASCGRRSRRATGHPHSRAGAGPIPSAMRSIW